MPMKQELYPAKIQQVVTALLTSAGRSPSQLRQAIAAYAACRASRQEATGEVPAALISYVEKVALYAYKTTDADVEQLIAVGYSEDEIFEITLSAALGASLAQLEQGMVALKGGQ
jgi:alkylhydroperoxidase family enzyme